MAAITPDNNSFKVRIKNLIIFKKLRNYIGSVRFFKHLILSTCVLLIMVPSFFAGNLFAKHRHSIENVPSLEQIYDNSVLLPYPQQEPDALLALMTDKNNSEHPYYEDLYPDFYAPQPISLTEYKEKTIHLTFDDGPSPRTAEILKILEEKDVKATFFVVGQNDEESYQWMRDIVAAGHTIGMHTYTHQYKTIYTSVESYLDDMYKMFTQIQEVTGVTPTVFRFPGGSINAYNANIYQDIISEMMRRGFVPYDWNISSEDAASNPPAANVIVSSVVKQASRVNHGVVLMHDSDYKYTTVAALPELIDKLKEQGFSFSEITPQTQPVIFAYNY